MSDRNAVHESVLKKWSEMVKTYSILHSSSAIFFAWWNKVLGIPVVILSAITASSIFATSDSDKIYTYVNGSLVLLITILTGVTKFLNISELETSHRTVSFKYISIGMNIDTVLSFSRTNRNVRPEDMLNSTKMTILDIREHAPIIPNKVISKFLTKKDNQLVNIKTDVNTTVEQIKQSSRQLPMAQVLSCQITQPAIFVPATGPQGSVLELPEIQNTNGDNSSSESEAKEENNHISISVDQDQGAIIETEFNDKISKKVLTITNRLNI